MTIQASGIMFVCGDTALFLRRGNGSSAPNLWAFPGGKIEQGEDALQGALREVSEETGVAVTPTSPRLWTRTLTDASEMTGGVTGSHPAIEGETPAEPDTVDFTMYLVRVSEQFTPKLCDEHDGYAWSPITAPPQPLHPGVQIALDRFTMDELDVAEAMAEGRLTSPQRYENVWLFCMRITGTGMSYRSGRDEYVLRDPSIYTNERFLKRCNGLQVIWDHPNDGKLLDDGEFKERTIGAIFLPYLRSDRPEDVWGVAKIYDEEAASLMANNQMSTSPAVNFKDPRVNSKVELDGGDTLLIEGDPSIIDHLAVCQNGVWDKGGDPTGVDAVDADAGLVLADSQKIAETPSSSPPLSSVHLLYAQATSFSLKSRLVAKR